MGLSSQGQPSQLTLRLQQRLRQLRRTTLNFLKGSWVGLLLLAAGLRGLWFDRIFLFQDLHFNGCDGLVTFPGGFEASTPPLCWLTHSLLPLMGLLFCYVRLTKCCSQVIFFIFLVTYSACLIFHFCVADLKAIQNVQNQPVPLFGRRIYFQNVRAFIF